MALNELVFAAVDVNVDGAIAILARYFMNHVFIFYFFCVLISDIRRR